MNIQSNINQTLSIMGLLAGQTPMAENQRAKYMEKQKVKDAYKDLDKYHQLADEGREIGFTVEAKAPGASLERKKQLAEAEATAQGFIAEKGKSAAQAVFEADPTEENYERFVRESTGPDEVKKEADKYIAGLEEQKAQIAQEKEQRRLARSAILEGIYTGGGPRTAKDTKRITKARGEY